MLALAPSGIRVNMIVPGLIRTYDVAEAAAVERGQVVPMGGLGNPEDLGGVLAQQRSTPVDTFPLRFPKL